MPEPTPPPDLHYLRALLLPLSQLRDCIPPNIGAQPDERLRRIDVRISLSGHVTAILAGVEAVEAVKAAGGTVHGGDSPQTGRWTRATLTDTERNVTIIGFWAVGRRTLRKSMQGDA